MKTETINVQPKRQVQQKSFTQYLGKTANKGFGKLKTKAQKNKQLFGKMKKPKITI